MPKLTLKKTTEGNNNQTINETTTNEINQIVESMLDMIKKGQQQATTAQKPQQQAGAKPGAPTAGGPIIIDRADFQKVYNDLQNIQKGMKSIDALARNLLAMSKKNKALLPLTESTVAITGKVMTAMVAMVKQIATSIRPSK